MKEIKITQGKIAFVDDENFKHLNKFKWHVLRSGSNFYAVRSIRLANGKQNKIFMHREILDIPKGLETDHINHNGLDNRKSNLRACTVSENQMNSNSQKNSSSRFKGVTWHKYARRWQAQIRHNGRTIYLRLFLSEIDAALAYNRKATEMFGKFANPNNVNIQENN